MIIGNRDFDFSRQTYVMGILNVTPDSFSDGGLYADPERALDRAIEMQEEGADLIDLGGESSRPGADPVSAAEEIGRVIPLLKKLVKKTKISISVDTCRSTTAEAALNEGASLINDISALGDPAMAGVIAKWNVPVILMHKKGEPKTMQNDVSYDDVVREVGEFLRTRAAFAVESGISSDRILIDPGIGFGKKFEHNKSLLDRLEEFKKLGHPVVFGASRKRFIQEMFGQVPQQVLAGSVAVALLAAIHGASIVRVHDVRETKAAIRLANLEAVL